MLARAGHAEEAVRTYSRRSSSSIPTASPPGAYWVTFTLGHSWYEPAYRQYKTITELDEKDPLGWLRLAAAAAGGGRVDEALRLERKVAGAQGTPGRNDPRRWARLWSAARIARLLANPEKPKPGQPAVDGARRSASLKRELKELSVFSGPGRLVVVTWQELSESFGLSVTLADSEQGLGDATDASAVGLYASLLTLGDAERAHLTAQLRTEPRDHELQLTLHLITWNGKDFQVEVRPVKLPARSTELAL
ncbi:MAG: hypothetical protein R3B13_38240 [Polyangiaceae bacterium]